MIIGITDISETAHIATSTANMQNNLTPQTIMSNTAIVSASATELASAPASATESSPAAIVSTSQNTKKKGYLELILGPMFSGKTSTLKKIYDQCIYCNIPVMVINYTGDKRYSTDDVMSTHDKIMIPCTMSNTISEILEKHGEKVSSAEVILINEGQFFADIEHVIPLVETLNKRIYICGLDGDFQKNKIGSLFELIPYCDNICKLKSLCSECRDGTPGLFSYRITNEVDQVVIGVDNYKPLCRVCYKRLTIEKESKHNAATDNSL